TASSSDEIVTLSPFTVQGAQPGRYVSTESASGGRVRADIMDATQSISVITHDLIEDIGAGSTLQAAKFVSGITESTIPNDNDRLTIRGFQTEGQVIDGFGRGGQAMLDPVFTDRIEVVKGPNAILSPTGSPGGTINVVTKKPKFSNFGSISGQVGVYDANRAEVDYNRVLSDNFAFRFVGAFQDTRGWAGQPYRTTSFMPEITYHNKKGTELTLQWVSMDFHEQDYFGVPIDPSAGTNTGANILAGIPRKLDYDGNTYRYDRRPAELRAFLTTPLSDAFSMRVAAAYGKKSQGWDQALAGGATGGGFNPLTGEFAPGVTYGPAPGYVASPATPQPRILPRAGFGDDNSNGGGAFQNDYIYAWKGDSMKLQAQGGFAYNYGYAKERQFAVSAAPINFDAPTPTNVVIGADTLRQNSNSSSTQLYVNSVLGLWNDRLNLSGGYTNNNFNLTMRDLLIGGNYEASVNKSLVFYGVVLKPIETVSLYYGHAENTGLNSAFNIAQGSAPTQDGKQNEVGVRGEFLEKRILATIAYFHITQSNFPIGNPANNTVPPPVPPLPALLTDRIAKGWEYELRAAITNGLSFIGNATTYTNRDANNIPLRGAAEKSAAGWLHYDFSALPSLKGFSAGIGADWLSKRSGDQGNGLTPANVPKQPSFYLPARTVVSMNLAYRFNKHWNAQVNMDNLLNQKYLQASLSRFDVWPGPPFNARLRVEYSF
ncbi:MAG TPA: TonB-dependent receptor, partial [Opitutaceae bacterium]|nr:TonB-dependent receptor [Opitutaceae bacterium]